VGWLLITSSLPRLPAALTSLLLMIQPVASVALAALIFSESPSAIQLLGVALVLGALVGATYRGRARVAVVRRFGYAIAGASGSRSSETSMSASENSGSSSRLARRTS
jgi:EamA domain-containing membrane protein RarD